MIDADASSFTNPGADVGHQPLLADSPFTGTHGSFTAPEAMIMPGFSNEGSTDRYDVMSVFWILAHLLLNRTVFIAGQVRIDK